MAHTADSKGFRGKNYTHHVIHATAKVALCGFTSEEMAKEDAEKRTTKAKNLGITATYIVKPVIECIYV